jgi:hypothetical protein
MHQKQQQEETRTSSRGIIWRREVGKDQVTGELQQQTVRCRRSAGAVLV